MAYTMLAHSGGYWGFPPDSLEGAALAFLRTRCEGLRFDGEKAAREEAALAAGEAQPYLGMSLKENTIPYNMQMDLERLCLERSLAQFLRSGRKEDAFDVYYCYLEMFVGNYEQSRRMIELLSEYEANGSSLLQSHRDHYSHSVYVFALGLAVYQVNALYRRAYSRRMGSLAGEMWDADSPKAACHFLKYWGLASLFHDIGYPFELPFEQVEAYWGAKDPEVRADYPFLAYRDVEKLTALDPELGKRLAEVLRLETRPRSTNALFALLLERTLSGTYGVTWRAMLEILERKPRHPQEFNHFMDHGWFSATVLFRKLFRELGLDLCPEHGDVLTAILLHNSLFKFSVAKYKKPGSTPLPAEVHPLAWMLMLCDELQCWDRTAYGRDSRKELHPFGCRFTLGGGWIYGEYLYDEKQRGKVEAYQAEYAAWARGDRKEGPPRLKAYSGMYAPEGGICGFAGDILRIVDLGGWQLTVTAALTRDDRPRGYLSDSSFLNLYRFTLLVKARRKTPEWKDKPGEAFRALPGFLEAVDADFHKTSLEYRLDCIDRTKSYARYMERLGCFYSDKPVGFPEVEAFTGEEVELLGALEHWRWLQFHYDMGWVYGTDWQPDKELRERMRKHNDLIRGYDPAACPRVPEAEAMAHYDALPEGEKEKDTKPMEFILQMLRHMDGVRFYRMRRENGEEGQAWES